AGIEVLERIQPAAPRSEIAAEADEILAASREQVSSGHFWRRQLQKPILLAILIAFFNQMSGINAILYFAPRIFELTGLAAKAALLQSVGIGIPIWCLPLWGSGSLTAWAAALFFISAHSVTLPPSAW